MRIILSVAFSLIVNICYSQTRLRTETIEEMDSLMCPQGYAAIDKPYMAFKLNNGNKIVDNKSLNGKIVLINFWFEGCHPCMAEMNALNEIFEKLKSNKNFTFISITWDNQETIKRVQKKYSLLFDVFPASSEECQRLNLGCGYPTSIILDQEGIVKFRHSGGSIEEPAAKKFIMTTLLSEIESLL